MYEMDCQDTKCGETIRAKTKEKLVEQVKGHYKTKHIINLPDSGWQKFVAGHCRKTED